MVVASGDTLDVELVAAGVNACEPAAALAVPRPAAAAAFLLACTRCLPCPPCPALPFHHTDDEQVVGDPALERLFAWGPDGPAIRTMGAL